MKPFFQTLLFSIFAAVLLSGCGGINFSPEAAAKSALMNSGGNDFTIDANTLVIHQSIKLDETNAMVVMAFQGTRAGAGLQNCVYSYRVVKYAIGWQPSSGGGGCSSIQPGEGVQPFDVNGGRTSGSDPNSAVSEVYGMVYKPEIVKIAVTWDDGQTDEVDVINQSYLVYRLGSFQMKQVDGLDQSGQVVDTVPIDIAPGKKAP